MQFTVDHQGNPSINLKCYSFSRLKILFGANLNQKHKKLPVSITAHFENTQIELAICRWNGFIYKIIFNRLLSILI